MAGRWRRGTATLVGALTIVAMSVLTTAGTQERESVTASAASTVATQSVFGAHREFGVHTPIRVIESRGPTFASSALPLPRVHGDSTSRARDLLAPTDLARVRVRALVGGAPAASPAVPAVLPSPASGSEDESPTRVDCAQAKCVALTFDDGPVEGTADLLDTLADVGARATFFVVGSRVDDHSALVARMHAEGHQVGNHTVSHPRLTGLSATALRDELAKTSERIEAATGEAPTVMRPPYGATNGAVASAAEDLGMAQVLWDVDPLDWKDRDADLVAARVTTQVEPGSIVLSHDLYDTTRDAYSAIVRKLVDEGYALVTVEELVGSVKPGQTLSHAR